MRLVAAGCDDAGVRTAVVSDLHLGLSSGADLLRRERFGPGCSRRSRASTGWSCSATCSSCATGRCARSLDAAAPAFGGARRGARASRELVIVPGNHDHHLIEPWLERRALDGAAPLALEQTGEPVGLAFEALAELADADRTRASPTRESGCATTSTPPTATTSTAT